VGLNEAQLINPQGTNKNMAARNKLIGEWTQYGGRVILEGKDAMVISKDGEFLFVVNTRLMVHIIPGKQVSVKTGDRWLTSHAPAWRGRARGIAEKILYRYFPRYYYLITLPPVK
jgi:hypothetical protein